MTDILTKRQRSRLMAKIRSTGNKDTELLLAGIFRANKIVGWRRHGSLPGKPDFVFRSARVVVFVDGCFWHGCRTHCRRPKSRKAFWRAKIERNMRRDREVARLLRKRGWKTLRVWEHALSRPDAVVARIKAKLAKTPPRNVEPPPRPAAKSSPRRRAPGSSNPPRVIARPKHKPNPAAKPRR